MECGASIINDVWGLKADPEMAQAAAETGAALILMHNQRDRSYGDLMAEVSESLAGSAAAAEEAGVARDQIILDPGIGFGKTAEHNLEILGRLREFKAMGYPLLVGASRKSTIGLVLDLPADQRLEGTAAAVALAIERGSRYRPGARREGNGAGKPHERRHSPRLEARGLDGVTVYLGLGSNLGCPGGEPGAGRPVAGLPNGTRFPPAEGN